jgi:hypothetical protein
MISCAIGKTSGKIKYPVILPHLPDNPQVAKKLRPPAEKRKTPTPARQAESQVPDLPNPLPGKPEGLCLAGAICLR